MNAPPLPCARCGAPATWVATTILRDGEWLARHLDARQVSAVYCRKHAARFRLRRLRLYRLATRLSSWIERADGWLYGFYNGLGDTTVRLRGRVVTPVLPSGVHAWDHPHEQVVTLAGRPVQMLCLECGVVYDPEASGKDGDPREWTIPAVLLAAQGAPLNGRD